MRGDCDCPSEKCCRNQVPESDAKESANFSVPSALRREGRARIPAVRKTGLEGRLMTEIEVDVIVVGAGLAGLCCARELHRRGLSFQVLERDESVGGRVQTDVVEGFRLDRGFQVLLTAYPEAKYQLNYDSLELRPFYPGALVRFAGSFHRVADPWRRPVEAMAGLTSPIGTFADKMRVAKLRRHVLRGTPEGLFDRPETTAFEGLRSFGFSDSMIDRFFRPFFGGVFLDRSLEISSRMFEFVFRMFAEGGTAVPRAGIGAIPDQLASSLPKGAIRTKTEVKEIVPGRVTLSSGETLSARAVVIATSGEGAAGWVRNADSSSRAVTCLYFSAAEAPIDEAILVLDGEDKGPVNNFSVPSALDPSLAPLGQSLLSATVLGSPGEDDETLDGRVRDQLEGWYGPSVRGWRRLAVYRIPHAQPIVAEARWTQRSKLEDRLYVCGDHRANSSIQGAMLSGRSAGEEVAADLM